MCCYLIMFISHWPHPLRLHPSSLACIFLSVRFFPIVFVLLFRYASLSLISHTEFPTNGLSWYAPVLSLTPSFFLSL